mgnify:CR=1 FL=1
MSVFAIKLLALVTMVIDHSAYYLYSSSLIGYGLYFAMRTAGRIAFPLYAFLLVNGFEKTSDRAKYLSRLVLFAAVSQLPYTVVFSHENYSLSAISGFALLWPWYVIAPAALAVCAVWYFCVRRDASVIGLAAALALAVVQLSAGGVCLLGFDTNVFYTLAVSLAGMSVLAMLANRPANIGQTLACLAAFAICALCILPNSDYGWYGFALMMLLYLSRCSKYLQAAVLLLWCCAEYVVYIHSWAYFAAAALAVIPVLLYNGRRGRPVKLFFYMIYPLHLAVLGMLVLISAAL